MGSNTIEESHATKPIKKKQPKEEDYSFLIRWLILIAMSFAMIGYGQLLPTLYADLFYELETHSLFLGRFAFFSMLFLQVLYVFGVHPRLAGRERGPKGDSKYLLSYIIITLIPWATIHLFGVLSSFLQSLNDSLSTLSILYLVVLLPPILLLELVVFWRKTSLGIR